MIAAVTVVAVITGITAVVVMVSSAAVVGRVVVLSWQWCWWGWRRWCRDGSGAAGGWSWVMPFVILESDV